MKGPKPGVRLLVVDEVMVPGGVDTVRRNLLPALAGACEELLWVVPDHRVSDWGLLKGDQLNLAVTGLLWPRTSWRRYVHALGRRGGYRATQQVMSAQIERQFLQERLRRLAAERRATHCLSTAVFDQPMPETDLPTAGVVYDLDPDLPAPVRANIVSWAGRAKATFTISSFTRDVLLPYVPDRAADIFSVPLAAPVLPPAECGRPPVFTFYYPAGTNRRKDHLTLFRACEQIAREGHPFRVVLSGGGTDQFGKQQPIDDAELEKARQVVASSALLRDKLVFKGHQPAFAVAQEYANSSCVVLPSKYEGFGLPLSEALQVGLPVICSDIPPFRQQIDIYDSQDSVKLFTAGDERHLAGLMTAMLRAEPRRVPADQVARRMARWTWRDVAHRYVEHLQQ